MTFSTTALETASGSDGKASAKIVESAIETLDATNSLASGLFGLV